MQQRTGPPCSEDLSSVSVQSISQPSSSESIQSAEEVSFLQETCDLCNVAEQSRNPQHRCRLCKNVVCNLFCSIQDPTSDNQRCTGYTSLVIENVSRFKVDLNALTVKRKFLVKETWMITSVRTMNTNIFVFYIVKRRQSQQCSF